MSYKDGSTSNPSPTNELSLHWQLLLSAAVFGTETTIGFYQIFAVLFLEYMGVPVSFISLDGPITVIFCIWLMPLTGYLTDRGAHPKTRKKVALLLGMLILQLAAILIFSASFIKLLHLTKQVGPPESGNLTETTDHLFHNPYRFTERSANYTVENWNHSTIEYLTISTPSILNEPESSSNSVSAVLAILGLALLNIGYDSTASTTRALILVSVPTHQQTSILTTLVIQQSISGTIFSILGVLDLPSYLGPFFRMDGICIAFMLFASYMFVCVTAGFIITCISSSLVEQRLSLKLRPLSNTRDLKSIHPKDKNRNLDESIFKDENVILSNIENKENGPLLNGDNKHKKRNYSSNEHSYKTRLQISNNDNQRFEKADVFQSIDATCMKESLPECERVENTPKFRLTRKLLIICASYFFGMGGLYAYAEYLPYVLTLAIYNGDPDAPPGSEGHASYQKGLKMAALGNLLLYISYLITCMVNKKIFNYIKLEIYSAIISTCFIINAIVFVIFKSEFLYFVNMIIFGVYRPCLYMIPFALATKYSQEGEGNEEDKVRNTGKVMSLLGVLVPIHYFILSTFMGPAIASTNDVWIPVDYGLVNFILSLLTLCLIFVWRDGKNS